MLKGILAKRKLKKSMERIKKSDTKKIKARSKRIAIEFKIPSKRIFNGREYRTVNWKTLLSAAKKVAKEQREAGYNTRLAEQWSGDGKKGWAIYIRK